MPVKMLMMAGLAVLLLGGGGAGAYYYFANPAEASLTEGEDTKTKKEPEKKYEYVELDPLVLPIVDNDGVSQIVSLVISLEVRDIAAVDTIKQIKPRLTDAYIQDLYGVLNKHAAMRGGVLQVGAIKSRLNRITQDVVQEQDLVNDVLLQVVQQRPI